MSQLNYDYYTNPTVLDIKLHRLEDVTGGINNTTDGSVDVSDFQVLVGQYGQGPLLPGLNTFDIGGGINGVPDGFVDTTDFGLLVGNYGQGIVEPIGY